MFKKQFFVFGASIAYGVGGTRGGWSGLLKNHIHRQLYGKCPLGEIAEVYNFAKPGATIDFVLNNFENQVDEYKRDVDTVAFILLGLNDVKALNHPDNYVSNEKKFEDNYRKLIIKMAGKIGIVNVFSFYDVDESKVYPKINPFNDSKSYFKNDRIRKFNFILKSICEDYSNVNFINISNLSDDWIGDCLFEDGLHPNDLGHEKIFDKISEYLEF